MIAKYAGRFDEKVPYRICLRCVMDTSDPLISFDSEGVCNHCHDWEKQWKSKKELEAYYPDSLLKDVKARAKRSRYDAVLGMSGGADSSYAYHLAKTLGLRVLPIHFDNGYDLPEYAGNVCRLTDKWGDELRTIKLSAEDFRRVQVAFLRSGTTGLEIPTDHAIKAVTYMVARSEKVPTIINGTNIATESHGTPAWTVGHSDWKYIRSVGELFGARPVNLPHYTPLDMATWMKDHWWLSILDYTYYNRDEAIRTLSDEYGYVPYGFKHGESRITRFLHGYIIPRRFGFDTRRSRVSAMISSGHMTRREGLDFLEKPAYTPEKAEEDRRIIVKQLGISDSQFESYMNLPLKTFWDYPSYTKALYDGRAYNAARWLYRRLLK